MRDLLKQTADAAAHYLETIDERGIAPTPEALARLIDFDHPLQENPCAPSTVLELLDRNGSPATVATAGRRYFGFVIAGSLPAALAANWLAGAWDQCASFLATSPVAAALENISLGW